MYRLILTFIAYFTVSHSLFSQSTASINVTTFSIEAPQLKTHKKIWVYLPTNYKEKNDSYPVFYMHDAQNLFDDRTSYVGEWKIDEYLDTINEKEIIVVGIEHGDEKRIDELTPFPNLKYGGGNGDNYLLFIKNTLKPHIDITYRTKSDAINTTIFGSSLGGLISFYAALKYPKTFGNAGVFSPSFWFSDDILTFIKKTELNKSTKLFLLAGTEESETMIEEVNTVIRLLCENGLPKENIKNLSIEGGNHNETFWRAYFPQSHQWLID